MERRLKQAGQDNSYVKQLPLCLNQSLDQTSLVESNSMQLSSLPEPKQRFDVGSLDESSYVKQPYPPQPVASAKSSSTLSAQDASSGLGCQLWFEED